MREPNTYYSFFGNDLKAFAPCCAASVGPRVHCPIVGTTVWPLPFFLCVRVFAPHPTNLLGCADLLARYDEVPHPFYQGLNHKVHHHADQHGNSDENRDYNGSRRVRPVRRVVPAVCVLIYNHHG